MGFFQDAQKMVASPNNHNTFIVRVAYDLCAKLIDSPVYLRHILI